MTGGPLSRCIEWPCTLRGQVMICEDSECWIPNRVWLRCPSSIPTVLGGVEQRHTAAHRWKEGLRQSASTEYFAHRLAAASVRPAGRLSLIARLNRHAAPRRSLRYPSANRHGGISLSWALVPSCRVLDWSPRHAAREI